MNLVILLPYRFTAEPGPTYRLSDAADDKRVTTKITTDPFSWTPLVDQLKGPWLVLLKLQ